MLLVRFAPDPAAAMRIGIAADDGVYDVSPKFASIAQVLARHPDGWNRELLPLGPIRRFERSKVRLGAPVDDGATVSLVGTNYKKHAEEAGLDVPQSPVIFQEPTTALVGPSDPLRTR